MLLLAVPPSEEQTGCSDVLTRAGPQQSFKLRAENYSPDWLPRRLHWLAETVPVVQGWILFKNVPVSWMYDNRFCVVSLLSLFFEHPPYEVGISIWTQSDSKCLHHDLHNFELQILDKCYNAQEQCFTYKKRLDLKKDVVHTIYYKTLNTWNQQI